MQSLCTRSGPQSLDPEAFALCQWGLSAWSPPRATPRQSKGPKAQILALSRDIMILIHKPSSRHLQRSPYRHLPGGQQVQKTSLGPNTAPQCQDDAKATAFLPMQLIPEKKNEEEENSQVIEYVTWFGHTKVANDWAILNCSDYLCIIFKRGTSELN